VKPQCASGVAICGLCGRTIGADFPCETGATASPTGVQHSWLLSYTARALPNKAPDHQRLILRVHASKQRPIHRTLRGPAQTRHKNHEQNETGKKAHTRRPQKGVIALAGDVQPPHSEHHIGTSRRVPRTFPGFLDLARGRPTGGAAYGPARYLAQNFGGFVSRFSRSVRLLMCQSLNILHPNFIEPSITGQGLTALQGA
jgi:hypothetical protein